MEGISCELSEGTIVTSAWTTEETTQKTWNCQSPGWNSNHPHEYKGALATTLQCLVGFL